MNIAEQAFSELFPDKDVSKYELVVKYTAKFKPYNANVRYSRGMFAGNKIQFNLSRNWRGVSREIQMGLIQELMLKVFKKKRSTTNIDLYNIFLKNVHIAVPKTMTEPELEDSFNRVNEKYFFGMIEQPNLRWGSESVRKLGSYEYGSDTITISRIFEGQKEMTDCVMYHEMLHKKHKFSNRNGRNYHHTGKFKREEKEFEDAERIEKEITKLIRNKRLKRSFFRF